MVFVIIPVIFRMILWKIKLIDNNNNNKIDGNRGYYV